MAQYASQLSLEIFQMYIWSKFEDSTSCGYLETGLAYKMNVLLTRTKAHANANADAH